jgi:hypothetical protein
MITAVTDLHPQAALELAQMLVELTAQRRQPVVIGGFQGDGIG